VDFRFSEENATTQGNLERVSARDRVNANGTRSRTCAAHDDGFRALVHQPVWHEFPFAGGIYEIVSEHAAGSA
jgi:hypothetical protein